MSISKYRERLEGSYRLVRIRKIKRGFIVMQIILALVVALLISFMVGMQFNPLFFPSDTFLFIFMIICLVITAEGVYFKGLEIRYTKSKSRRFLIARNSIRRSIIIVAISLVFVILLLLPMTGEWFESGFKDSQSVHSGTELRLNATDNSSLEFSFPSSDPMGFVYAESVYLEFSDETNLSNLNVNISHADGVISRGALSAPLGNYSTSRTEFTISISVTSGATLPDETYSINTNYRFSSIYKQYLPILGVIFIMVQLTSITIMFPLRELYATSSIYSKRYVEEKASGEESRLRKRLEAAGKMSEEEIRKAVEQAEKEDAMLEEAVAIEDVVTADADEVHRVDGILRKKGEVDEGLAMEEDVPCDNCGEMNSPSAAMCYVCGTPLVAKEVTIDIGGINRKGGEFLMDRKFDEAVQCYDHVLMHDKRNIEALLGKSKALNMQGKWGMAVQYVNTILQLDSRNVEGLTLKGNILEARGKLERALEVYQQVLDIDPSQKPVLERKELIKEQLASIEGEMVEEDEDAVMEAFMELPGIGLAKAAGLYEAGFTSVEKLKSASIEELAEVKGISAKLAKKIKDNI